MENFTVTEQEIAQLAEFLCLEFERDSRRYNREISAEEDEA